MGINWKQDYCMLHYCNILNVEPLYDLLYFSQCCSRSLCFNSCNMFFKLAMTDFHSFYMFSFALKDFLFSYKTVEGCRQPLHIVQKCKQCLDEKTTTREPASSTSPGSDHQKYVKGKVL